MSQDDSHNNLEEIHNRLTTYFPTEHFSSEQLIELLESGDILSQPSDFVSFLKSSLLEEKILEVEIDGLTRIYSCRLYDNYPDLVEEEVDGVVELVEPDYSTGEYLKEMSFFNSWPLEPAIGNLTIRNSRHVLFRLFTPSYAVELGTHFRGLVDVRDVPVLRFDYPVIGRIVRGARAYRAKIPKEMNFITTVLDQDTQKELSLRVVDISVRGMGFQIENEQQSIFAEYEDRIFDLIINGVSTISLKGNLRHISKIRGKNGTEYICGTNFDLANREVASKIETIVARVQRDLLKELSDLADENGHD